MSRNEFRSFLSVVLLGLAAAMGVITIGPTPALAQTDDWPPVRCEFRLSDGRDYVLPPLILRRDTTSPEFTLRDNTTVIDENGNELVLLTANPIVCHHLDDKSVILPNATFLDEVPNGARPYKPEYPSSERKTKTILFRPAHDNERGYRGVTFDVEYQFIVCSGELHIAYSIVEDSVRRARNNIGSDFYSLGGHLYKVSPPPNTILNLPLKGRVFYSFLHASTIGTFADDHAGKALGFGCFSGQSQKIADVKDLRDENGGQPSKEYLPKILNLLGVSFETTQVLTSAEAEDEIRAGSSKAAGPKDEHADKAAGERPQADQGPSEADLRAQRRAQEEAEFQAKQKAYEEGMAAHDAAVEQYKKALADMEAQKVANAAATKTQQEEFARKQAQYEAEAAKAKQAQDEYEAKYGKPQ